MRVFFLPPLKRSPAFPPFLFLPLSSLSLSLSLLFSLTLFVSRKSIMYSFASACALTRVSVPTTGSAKASRTTKASPAARPASMPMTSRSPPDLACIAIFSRARAEMWTLLVSLLLLVVALR